MKFSDTLKLAGQNLWRTRLRSLLTVLGVVIGISAIVLFVSLGVGLQKITSDQIANTNSLTTMTVSQSPASASMEEGSPLTDKTVKQISAINNVKITSPSITMPANVSSGGTSAASIVNGISYDYIGTEVPTLKSGTYPKDDTEVVISSMLAGSFVTEKSDAVGKEVVIDIIGNQDGLNFKIDSLKLKVSAVDNNDSTNTVYAPLQKVYAAGKFEEYSTLKVIVKSSKDVESVQKTIKNFGYQTTTIKDLIDQIDNIFLLVQIILGVVAGIGLLVSSLGIINTMIISLLERTREIGIMKAIGAANKDIKRMFYLETALIGLTGGILGVGLAALVGKFFNYILNVFMKDSGQYLELFITPYKFGFAMILFAIALSLFAGFYPAKRAQKLSPMFALRQ